MPKRIYCLEAQTTGDQQIRVSPAIPTLLLLMADVARNLESLDNGWPHRPAAFSRIRKNWPRNHAMLVPSLFKSGPQLQELDNDFVSLGEQMLSDLKEKRRFVQSVNAGGPHTVQCQLGTSIVECTTPDLPMSFSFEFIDSATLFFDCRRPRLIGIEVNLTP